MNDWVNMFVYSTLECVNEWINNLIHIAFDLIIEAPH